MVKHSNKYSPSALINFLSRCHLSPSTPTPDNNSLIIIHEFMKPNKKTEKSFVLCLMQNSQIALGDS